MDSKKSNKIRDIVRLQQILKKWRKTANASKNNNTNSSSNPNSNSNTSTNTSNNNGGGNKGMKFLKKTLSFSESTFSSVSTTTGTEYHHIHHQQHNHHHHVPRGYLAVCVGKELKRYVIPTEYLGHQAFGILLREAEEEFGFHQEGVLKIPCDVSVFENILKMVQLTNNNNKKKNDFLNHHHSINNNYNDFYLHDNNNYNYNNVGSFEFHASDIDVMSSNLSTGCCSPDCDQLLQPSLPQLCR